MNQEHSRLLKLWGLLLTMMAVLAMTAMVTYAAPKISKKKVTLLTGQKVTLKVTGTKKKITWSSNKKSVATVTKKGKVTAKKKGTATITAKVGKKKLKCKVTVEAPKISKRAATLQIGKKLILKMSGTKQTVTWKSSNKAVAAVSKKGLVLAKKAGSAEITATVLKKEFTCEITVPEAEAEQPEEKPSDSGSTDSGTSKPEESASTPSDSRTPAPEESTGFVFARDCKIISGQKTIYIEFDYNEDTTTKKELEEEGFSVTGGKASKNVPCETATYVFTKLPTTLEEIKAFPIQTKFGPVAAAICACAAFDTSKSGTTYQYTHPIFDMMDYLNGPSLTIANAAKSDIYYSMVSTLLYGKMAYFNGATPSNGYTPTKPYTFTLVHGPYVVPARSSTVAYKNGTPECHMILISFAGDDEQRYVDVYSSKDGNWYIWDKSWQHLVASMKAVSTSDW